MSEYYAVLKYVIQHFKQQLHGISSVRKQKQKSSFACNKTLITASQNNQIYPYVTIVYFKEDVCCQKPYNLEPYREVFQPLLH